MAKEIRRRFNTAARQVVIDIEDSFGHITSHSISLMADRCPHCGQILPGTSGSPDVNASAVGLVAHVHDQEPELIAKFEAAAQSDPELLKHIHAAKAKRGIDTTPETPAKSPRKRK